MKIDDEIYYHLASDGVDLGWLTGADLKLRAASGKWDATKCHLWTDGEPEWVPADACEGLFPPGGDHAPTPPPLRRSAGGEPTHSDPVQNLAPARMVSFWRYLLFAGTAMVLEFAAIVCVVLAVVFKSRSTVRSGRGFTSQYVPNRGYLEASEILMYVGGAFGIVAFIFGLVILARAWRRVQSLPDVRCSPSTAVWFHFIPLFNLYWIFVAWVGWAKDYAALILQRREVNAPHVSAGVISSGILLTLIGLAGILLVEIAVSGRATEAKLAFPFFIAFYAIYLTGLVFSLKGMAEICRATNHLADQHNANLRMALAFSFDTGGATPLVPSKPTRAGETT